ncbi:MAG: hypothetical protein ACI9KE_005052 [Polyangiales bacterium]|jgi:hypothetical protein
MYLLDSFEDALAVSPVDPVPRSYMPTFLRAADWPDAPVIPPRGEPYDERGRFDLDRFPNYVSPRICLRLDLKHPSVPAHLSWRLAQQNPSDLGEDGALYLYESSEHSQHANEVLARARLTELLKAAQEPA